MNTLNIILTIIIILFIWLFVFIKRRIDRADNINALLNIMEKEIYLIGLKNLSNEIITEEEVKILTDMNDMMERIKHIDKFRILEQRAYIMFAANKTILANINNFSDTEVKN
jgi:hypothetical protein